ncbi:MAG: hypothetical protein GX971_00175 [Firmicutes bacterium]|nr:hypothetical protein [Bacillota bacterium]
MQDLTKNRRKYLPVLFAFLGILLFINLFSTADYQLLSVLVNLKARFSPAPQTRVVIPPVGEVRANTHWVPLQISVELRSVDLASLRKTVFSPSLNSEAVLETLRRGVAQILVFFVLRLAVLGSAGALFGLFFLGVRDLKQLFWGSLGGSALVFILAIMLATTYVIGAFEDLEYEGMIEAAPWVLNVAWQALDQVEELGGRVQALASNLYAALQRLEEMGPLGLVEADVLVLHVSDIHNNPIAYSFATQVIDSFSVDFIIDTGDLTDWGTALEAEITRRIETLGLPYLFVSGNHDSPEVIRKVNAIPNAQVVSGEETTVAGLRIAGVGDLVADSYLPTPASIAELEEMVNELNRRWTQVEDRPDIFLVHNHRVAEKLTPGLFPVVAYGHTHLWGVRQVEGTVYSNAGTTGAAGIRGFQGKEPLPYSLSLLYFAASEEGRLILRAVDGVHVTGLGMSFSLQRTFLEQGRNSNQDVEIIH